MLIMHCNRCGQACEDDIENNRGHSVLDLSPCPVIDDALEPLRAQGRYGGSDEGEIDLCLTCSIELIGWVIAGRQMPDGSVRTKP